MTLLPLEHETRHCTSEEAPHPDPCAVASCRDRRQVELALTVGGRVQQVPLCTRHADHWR